MSDTPETDAKRITDIDVHMRPAGNGRWTGDTNIEVVPADFARQLERERNHAQALVAEMKQAIVWAKAEAKERLHRLDQAACERRTWLEAHEKMKRERDEANAQMCQAIGHLSDIAEACQDWLDSIIQEPAVDFIKAIRDWAKRKVEGK